MDIVDFFNTLDFDGINRLVADGKEENLFLDFKLLGDSPLGGQDDKRNLAKALSGFANSSGGVIVWGVDSRPNDRNGEKVDCAYRTKMIKSLPLLMSRLNGLTGEYVSPDVDGVQHRSILTGSDEGFAVTLIPESDRGPHMAKAGEDRYYKRSGDSFYRMEHYDIADMFGKRHRPRLAISHSVTCMSCGVSDDGVIYARLKADFSLENNGRAVARSPFIQVQVAKPYSLSQYGMDGNYGETLPRQRRSVSGEQEMECFGSRSDYVIHPGMKLDVFSVLGEEIPLDPGPPDLNVSFRTGAEDIAMMKGNYSIRGGEFMEKVLRSYPDILNTSP